LTDDGKLAIVEFITTDRAAFQEIFNDKQILVFEKGSTRRPISRMRCASIRRISHWIISG